jgi:hypothetical protein
MDSLSKIWEFILGIMCGYKPRYRGGIGYRPDLPDCKGQVERAID